MISKKIILPSILLTTFSLIPLYIFTLINLVFFKSHLDYKNPTIERRKIEQDMPQIIEAAKKGYLPFFNPLSLRNYFLDTTLFPVGGLPYTQTYFCNEGYGLQTYKSDRLGLRNIDSNWDQVKNKGATFFVGDSYVHGACVEEKWTITSIVEKMTGENILNIGASANTPYEYVGAIKGIVSPVIKEFPDQKINVALVFYDNDNVAYLKAIDNLSNKARRIIKKLPEGSIVPTQEYLNKLNQVIKTNFPLDQEGVVNAISKPSKKSFKQFFAYKFFTLMPLRQRIKAFIAIIKDNEVNPTTKSINLLKKVCLPSSNCNPYIIYIPSSKIWSRQPSSNFYRLSLKKLSEENNIQFIDGSMVIDRNSLDDFAIRGNHLSPKGYVKIAELYAKETRK